MNRKFGWWLALCAGWMLSLPSVAGATLRMPHTVESRLDKTSDVVVGVVLPGERQSLTYRKVQCARYLLDEFPLKTFNDCYLAFYSLRVQEVLKGSAKPGEVLTIIDWNRGLDPATGSIRFSIGAPVFAVGETALVFLGPPQEFIRVLPSYGKVYRVVGDETGKWYVSPDGALQWGTDPSAGPERIPFPVSTRRPTVSVPARDAFGPHPPQVPDPADPKEPPPSMGGVTNWGDRIEYGWPLDPGSPARTKAYLEQMNQTARSKDSSVAESLTTEQPVLNRSSFTLEEMRQIVDRHLQQGKEKP